jgi:hypothetical protein
LFKTSYTLYFPPQAPITKAAVWTQVGFLLNTLHYPPQSPLIKGGRIPMDWLPSLALLERLHRDKGRGEVG